MKVKKLLENMEKQLEINRRTLEEMNRVERPKDIIDEKVKKYRIELEKEQRFKEKEDLIKKWEKIFEEQFNHSGYINSKEFYPVDYSIVKVRYYIQCHEYRRDYKECICRYEKGKFIVLQENDYCSSSQIYVNFNTIEWKYLDDARNKGENGCLTYDEWNKGIKFTRL